MSHSFWIESVCGDKCTVLATVMAHPVFSHTLRPGIGCYSLLICVCMCFQLLPPSSWVLVALPPDRSVWALLAVDDLSSVREGCSETRGKWKCCSGVLAWGRISHGAGWKSHFCDDREGWVCTDMSDLGTWATRKMLLTFKENGSWQVLLVRMVHRVESTL